MAWILVPGSSRRSKKGFPCMGVGPTVQGSLLFPLPFDSSSPSLFRNGKPHPAGPVLSHPFVFLLYLLPPPLGLNSCSPSLPSTIVCITAVHRDNRSVRAAFLDIPHEKLAFSILHPLWNRNLNWFTGPIDIWNDAQHITVFHCVLNRNHKATHSLFCKYLSGPCLLNSAMDCSQSHLLRWKNTYSQVCSSFHQWYICFRTMTVRQFFALGIYEWVSLCRLNKK